jgi:multidrug efflux pump subunit AcrA (membrane-fusion protein)
MHPTVVSDKPGTCPVCGMNLVRQARPGEEVKVTEDLAMLIKSPNEMVVASIKTAKGEFKSMPVSVEAQGLVTYDTRNIFNIPARIGGRLEKVYLKYVFQDVRKGQKVAEIYSPELITAQRELLYLIENDPSNTSLIESSKNKLYLLGVTQNQVEELIERKDVSYTFSIYSPYNGYVISEVQQAPAITTSAASSSSSGMGGDMAGLSKGSVSPTTSSGTMNISSSELIREGNYVSTGQTLFKVINPSGFRVELDLPLAQAGKVNINAEIDLELGDGTVEKGKIDFVQPFFTAGQEFVKVRVYLKSRPDLRIGQLVHATIHSKPVEALWVPREAVLNLGLDNVVFVKEQGIFKPRNVNTGVRTDGWVQVIQGITSSEEFAVNAQYLVDSESFIKAE